MSTSLDVLHVNFAKGFRGGERQTLNLMLGLLSKGMSQALVCRRGSELALRAKAEGLTIVPVSHPLSGHLSVPPARLIHVHEARGGYWAGIETLLRKTPYLITRRIPNPVSTNAVTLALYRHAGAVVAVSANVANGLKQLAYRKPAIILDGCMPLPVNDQLSAKIRQRCGHGPIIGHVGALQDHHKGQSVLIAAFQKLVKTTPHARLLLIGNGPDFSRFKQLANDDPAIIFAGFQEDVGSWLAAMDLFVFPSREEGLGSSVLDAMLLGIPVIAAKIGGLPELIGNDARGWLVEGHEPAIWCKKIVQVLSDPSQQKLRAEEALKFAIANNIEAMASAYLKYYSQILNPLSASI